MRLSLSGYLQGGGRMLMLRPTCPVDYSLCNQTVTIYHWDGKETYTRKVIEEGAFLDFKKTQNVDKTGSSEVNTFLLVIPGSEVPVAVGDKVIHGEGPEIATRESWAAFIPAKIPGLGVVKWVDPKFWRGSVVHTEAGG